MSLFRRQHNDPNEWKRDPQAVRRWLFNDPTNCWRVSNGTEIGDAQRTEIARNLIDLAVLAEKGAFDDDR